MRRRAGWHDSEPILKKTSVKFAAMWMAEGKLDSSQVCRSAADERRLGATSETSEPHI